MRKKLVSVLLCAGMIASMAAGCGSNEGGNSKQEETKSSDGKVVLNVINYHVGTDYAAEYYDYLFTEFQKTEEGKNVEFKFEEIPTTDAYNQKIKLLLSSGDLPDIVFNGGNNIINLAVESGKVQEILCNRRVLEGVFIVLQIQALRQRNGGGIDLRISLEGA